MQTWKIMATQQHGAKTAGAAVHDVTSVLERTPVEALHLVRTYFSCHSRVAVSHDKASDLNHDASKKYDAAQLPSGCAKVVASCVPRIARDRLTFQHSRTQGLRQASTQLFKAIWDASWQGIFAEA